MANFLIENFRGCVSAEAELGHITLIAGKNRSGKTSLLLAIAAALTGRPVPYIKPDKDSPALSKTDAKKDLVRSGCGKRDKAQAYVDLGDASIVVDFRKIDIVTQGAIQFISPISAGLVNLVEMPPKSRIEYISKLLGAEVTADDLSAVLDPLKLDIEEREQIVDIVVQHGLTSAYGRIKERGTALKGRWEEITGESYGSQKSCNWGNSLTPKALDEAEKALADAKKSLEIELTKSGASAAERRILEESASRVDNLNLTLTGIQKKLASLRQIITETQKIRVAAPSAESGEACPYCGEALEVRRHGNITTIAKGTHLLSKEEQSNRLSNIAKLDGEIARLQGDIYNLDRNESTVIAALGVATADAAKLKTLPVTIDNEEEKAAIKVRIEQLEAVIGDHIKAHRASRIATMIELNNEILALLAPDGLQHKKLLLKLSQLNELLSALCDVAKWPLVSIDTDGETLIDGRKYFVSSESEKFRANVITQLAISQIEKSPFVIIDGIDILDADGRAGLILLCSKAESKCLLGCTAVEKEKIVKLTDLKLGVTYWMENGELSLCE